MDLYKAIIITASVLAIPSTWWAYDTQNQVVAAKVALSRAGNELDRIGEIAAQLETVASGQRMTGGEQYRIFFEQQINQATQGTMSSQNFSISAERPRRVTARQGGRQSRAEDVTVDLKFEKDGKPMPLSRDVVDAILAFCERPTGKPQVWKVRQFQMQNQEFVEAQRKRIAPPRTVSNNQWMVRRLTFARRRPQSR